MSCPSSSITSPLWRQSLFGIYTTHNFEEKRPGRDKERTAKFTGVRVSRAEDLLNLIPKYIWRRQAAEHSQRPTRRSRQC